MSRLVEHRRRMATMQKQADDVLYAQRWFYYAKANGIFLPDALDDWFFTGEQEIFFAEYEAQLELDRVFRTLRDE